MTDLVLGIDTGGTFTDGVLMDYARRKVLATSKTPTTPHDLKACILAALDDLLIEDLGRIGLVAISTTLATNAIVEEKGRPVGLMLLGYDPELVARFRFDRRFATNHLAYLKGGHDLHGREKTALDRDGIVKAALGWKDQVEALAVSGYFSPFNPSHEEAAAELIGGVVGLPIVLGHQLSRRLNSVERATTAVLNAALMPILRDFIQAMRQALDQRGIHAPLMVVRGDGALTRGHTAGERPVETVLSGPAASVIGGGFLSGRDQALVVDIGGTTTDLAIMDGGRVHIGEGGARVGPYRTAVQAVDVRTIGLGGDSAIGLDAEDHLLIGLSRVMPISHLAGQIPEVAADLRARSGRLSARPSPDSVEYWFLQREPSRPVEGAKTKRAIDLLREGPKALPDLLERLGLFHSMQFDGPQWVREGVIGRAGLTPTDLLHVTGEYAPWDVASAQIAGKFVAQLAGQSLGELTGQVKEQMAERIVAEIVAHITRQDVGRALSQGSAPNLGTWLFEESMHPRDRYLASDIRLNLPIVGLGAPAAIFLPRVAELLGTELLLPPHFEVANAVGAVAGSLVVEKEAWVYPQASALNVSGYYAQLADGRHHFNTLDAALAAAQQELVRQAEAEIHLAGAIDPAIDFDKVPDGLDSYRVRVRAFANPGLGEMESGSGGS